MQDLPKITNQLEFLFLKRIATELRAGTLTPEAAISLANVFLKIEPFSSIEDAKQKIESFIQKNAQFNVLKEYLDAYFSEQQKDVLIEKMREHIKAGNIDQAIQVAKQ